MEENTDLISSLPADILHHIISRLSFKEAVRSSALSTSWRNLMSPTRANFDTPEQLKRRIGSLAKSGVNFQQMKLHLRSSDDAAAFAVCTKGVNAELHLLFSEHRRFSVNFGLNFRFDGSGFSHVKILHLRSISNVAGEAVSDLCSRFSSLESLRIEKCGGLESIDVESSQSLRNFEMADCADIVRVSVSARKLESFTYKGVFALLQFLSVPNLASASIDFGDGLGKNGFDCEDFLSLLSSLKDIETLTLSSCFIEAMCCAGVIFNKLDFDMSKLKNLKLICSKITRKTRDSFACFLHMTPSLEELQLKKIERGSSCKEMPVSYQNWHEPHLWKDYAAVKSEACRLKQMKRIKISGFTMEEDELLWIDLFLHIAINLKEMIVDDCWRVLRVPYSQLSFLKLQYFLVPCPHIDSFFVLIAL